MASELSFSICYTVTDFDIVCIQIFGQNVLLLLASYLV